MKLKTPILVVRPRAVVLLWAALILPLASCLELESRTCSEELTCPSGTKCSADRSACIATPCGNGLQELDEQCDDGNLRDGDGCSHDCRSTEACGNNTLDSGEVCDDGNTLSGDGCSADCHSKERCGNGITDSAVGERCDDGNNVDGDGCSADCHSQEGCGNRITDSAIGEICDDGNNTDGDGCSADCRSGESCGNGIEDVNEECDDKNDDNNDNCVKSAGKCLLSRCGDGFIDKEAPGIEDCDDEGESKTCDLDCTFAVCGDRIVNGKAGEQCDTGIESAQCNADCSIARCGDGYVNRAAGEECDDGNSSNADDCLSTCKFSTCGDGHLDAWENCDDGNRNACGTCGASCQEYQFAAATGSIIAVAEDSIWDGETFSISDGIHLPKIFEFDTNTPPSVTPGRIPVSITSGMDAESVAKAIRKAINQTPDLNIDAVGSDSSSSMTLTNNTPRPGAGALGNQRIIETVRAKGFKVTGMSGGGSRDCPAGMGCVYGEDCVSGNCTNGVCVN